MGTIIVSDFVVLQHCRLYGSHCVDFYDNFVVNLHIPFVHDVLKGFQLPGSILIMIDVTKAFCASNAILNNTGFSAIAQIWHNGDIQLHENT